MHSCNLVSYLVGGPYHTVQTATLLFARPTDGAACAVSERVTGMDLVVACLLLYVMLDSTHVAGCIVNYAAVHG